MQFRLIHKLMNLNTEEANRIYKQENRSLVAIFFYLFLVSLPFGYRALVYQWTSGFNEYESAFLYAPDIFMILFLGSFFVSCFNRSQFNFQFLFSNLHLIFKSQFSKNTSKLLASYYLLSIFFLFFAALSILWASLKLLTLYNFVRLLLLVLMSFVVAYQLRNSNFKLRTILGVLAGLSIIQSSLGFLQFLFQKSLGLRFLGESVLGYHIVGSAKIIVDGAPILRAYGTFPHPNVLSAFLVLGLLSLFYFWFKFLGKRDFLRLNALAVAIFIVLLGILLTFSRAAWLITILISLLVIGYSLLVKNYRVQVVRLLVLLLAVSYVLSAVLSPFVFSRTIISSDEPAFSYRLSYNKIGWNIIKENPLGVGLGNQVVYAVKNDVYKMAGLTRVWEWQPVHNLYLLLGAEIGVLGLAAFIIFIAFIIFNFKFLIFNQFSNNNYIPKAMLLSLLAFGMFDHFLWTLEPGRLMFWLVIGMVMGNIMKHNSNEQFS